MFEDLNRRLEEVTGLQREQRRLEDHLQRLQEEIDRQAKRLEQIEADLRKESRDVEKLENLSLTSLFYSVLGSKETQIEKERQEYLAAKLVVDQCRYALDSLHRQEAGLKEKLVRLGDVDARYETLMAEKEKALAQAGDERSRRLIQISEALATAQSQERELYEAIQAGKAALQGIQQVREALQSAASWGVWDMLGGGLLATAAKHQRIDDSRQAAYLAQDLLGRFQRELADVPGASGDYIAQIGAFETFADYFFDGLIVDWVVQSKIDRSLEAAVSVYERVGEILSGLSARYSQAQDKVSGLKDEKRQLVESAE
jgi:DNA repair exonuclease SbcCD ATPase subunit